MPAASFTEFFVTQGVSASATNGGGPRIDNDGGPMYALGAGATGATATDSGADSNIEDLLNGGWAGVVVDDFLCFDTAGLKEYTKVIAVAVGGDADVIKVHPMVTAAAQKACRVGGAWALPSAAVAIVNALGTAHAVNAAGNPPRLNIKRHTGTPYIDALISLTTAFTAACPLTFEGYDDAPGDIDPWVSNNRTTINTTGNSSNPIISMNAAYNRLLNVGGTAGGTSGRNALKINSSTDNCTVRNCAFTSLVGTEAVGNGCWMNSSVTDLVMDRCIFENNTACGIYTATSLGPNNKFSRIISRNNALHGIMGFGSSMILEDSLIYGNGGCGIIHLSNLYLKGIIRNNTIADNVSHGIDFGTMDIQTVEIADNIIADNGGADINSDLTTLGVMFGLFGYNCLHGNASTIADDAYVCIPTAHNITSEPWTELTQATRKATGVYTTMPAMKGVGAGAMPDSAIANPTSYPDLGYYQEESPTDAQVAAAAWAYASRTLTG